MLINNKGSKTAPVWIVCERPLSTDVDRGYLFSGGLGLMYDSMLKDAGFAFGDYYICTRRPDTKDDMAFANVHGELNQYRPPIVITLDQTGFFFCKELKNPRKGSEEDSELSKYCGSLLVSDQLNYPHYVIPTYGPQTIAAQYKMRDIVVACDLAKAKSELDYYRDNQCQLQPLPQRKLKYKFDTFDELIQILNNYMHYDLLSDDIETIYPKAGTSSKTRSKLYKIHPGYPITVALSPSQHEGISFELFRESAIETRLLWQKVNQLHKKVRRLGQNFINFDSNFYEMLGFEVRVKDVIDTLIRHHILWPELSHKLAFMTRQYTRQPFYKDDGNNWNGKNLENLMRYNALDTCTTFNVYDEQELEFLERPHLK